MAGQAGAVDHPLPHQAGPVGGVQDPGEGRLRDAGGQMQVVQAGGTHLLQRLEHEQAPGQRLDGLDPVLPHNASWNWGFSPREIRRSKCCSSQPRCTSVAPMTGAAGAPATLATAREGDLLWTPSPDRAAATPLAAFTRFAEESSGHRFPDYATLWEWATTDLDGCWQAIWDFFDVRSSPPHTAVLAERTMPGARWFPGARLNFAEHILRNERPGTPALLYAAEGSDLQEFGWDEFGRQVRAVATHLRQQGLGPGDRVVGFLPNVPEAIVAMVATASLGAVWAGVS